MTGKCSCLGKQRASGAEGLFLRGMPEAGIHSERLHGLGEGGLLSKAYAIQLLSAFPHD